VARARWRLRFAFKLALRLLALIVMLDLAVFGHLSSDLDRVGAGSSGHSASGPLSQCRQ